MSDPLVIDPRGCACTDCLTGESYPLGSPIPEHLIINVNAGMAPFINRSGVRVAIRPALFVDEADSDWRSHE